MPINLVYRHTAIFEQNNIIFFHVIHYYIVTVIIAVIFLYILYCSFFLSQVVNINLNNILDLSRYNILHPQIN